jgi:hypothetical protein
MFLAGERRIRIGKLSSHQRFPERVSHTWKMSQSGRVLPQKPDPQFFFFVNLPVTVRYTST